MSSLLLKQSYTACNSNLIYAVQPVETKMAFRKKLGNRQSKKYFSKTAGSQNVHPKNANIMPMRGGIRA